MNFILDPNTIVSGILVLGLAFSGRTLWKTAIVVERLDERTKQHGERIESLEGKV